MGHKKSKHLTVPLLHESVLRRITTATSFLPDEIQYFYYDFHKYAPSGHLTLADFQQFYRILFRRGLPDRFAKLVFDAYDINRDNIVDFEEFITGLYYTTKATPSEKIRWAFDLCDRDGDHQLDTHELENVIDALYDLSEADMPRQETFDESLERVKQLFLTSIDDKNDGELLESVTKGEFVEIVQKDASIMKLIECRSTEKDEKRTGKRATLSASRLGFSTKKLKFKRSKDKSLSDSTLSRAITTENK